MIKKWQGMLSNEKKKIIIAPGGKSPWANDWIPKNWISLEA